MLASDLTQKDRFTMIHRLQTEERDRACRLDHYLSLNVEELSKGNIRKIIDLGGVHVDGRRTLKCGKKLLPNQAIEMHRDLRSLTPYRIQQQEVIFQDKYLIVLNKPAGVETQPTPSRYKGTLYEALQIWLKRDPRFRKLQIGMAQRLDRNTSGLIVFSIHPQSHKGLSEQIRNRTIGKHYLALVAKSPSPPEGTFRSLLARERRSNRMKSVEKGGKDAVTHYKTMEVFKSHCLVAVKLETGRTHQIRVHFSEVGSPLLGDSRYGGPVSHNGKKYTRQCLHSWKLELKHPISGDSLHFETELPEDMQLQSP